jgi:beta-lactamase regulating signal transducer with metallopeptidase domain
MTLDVLELWLAHPITEHIGWVVVHTVWQGALLAGLLAGALSLLRDEHARLRYALSLITLTALALTPIVTWVVLPVAPAEAVVSADASGHMLAGPAVLLTETAPAAEPGAAWMAAARAGFTAMLPGVAVAWMIGVSVLAARLLGGWMLTVRLRTTQSVAVDGRWQRCTDRLADRIGVTWPVRVRQSTSVDVPLVVGWLRPVVLVPAGILTGLPPRQIEALIAHELSHVRRHDVLVGWLQALVETLLFYHPAVWWVSKQVRVEREHCCDDLAVALCQDRVMYAHALTTLADRQQVIPAGGLGAAGGALLNRIRRLIGTSPEPSPRRYQPPLGVVGLVLLAGALGIAACASQRPTDTDPETMSAGVHVTSLPGADSLDEDTSRESVDVYIVEEAAEENGRGLWKRRVMVDSSGHVTVWSDSGRTTLPSELDSLDGVRAAAPGVWLLWGPSDTIPRPPRPLRLRRAPFDSLAFSFPDPPDIEWEVFRGLDSLRVPRAVAPPPVFFPDRDTLDLEAFRLRTDSLRIVLPRGLAPDSLGQARLDSLERQVQRQVRLHREEVRRALRRSQRLDEALRDSLRQDGFSQRWVERQIQQADSLRDKVLRHQPERLREQADALRRQAERLEEQARELEDRRPPAPDTTGTSSRRHPVPFDAAPLGTLRAGSPISRVATTPGTSVPVYVLALDARGAKQVVALRATGG